MLAGEGGHLDDELLVTHPQSFAIEFLLIPWVLYPDSEDESAM